MFSDNITDYLLIGGVVIVLVVGVLAYLKGTVVFVESSEAGTSVSSEAVPETDLGVFEEFVNMATTAVHDFLCHSGCRGIWLDPHMSIVFVPFITGLVLFLKDPAVNFLFTTFFTNSHLPSLRGVMPGLKKGLQGIAYLKAARKLHHLFLRGVKTDLVPVDFFVAFTLGNDLMWEFQAQRAIGIQALYGIRTLHGIPLTPQHFEAIDAVAHRLEELNAQSWAIIEEIK